MATIDYQTTIRWIDGSESTLQPYRNRVLLIVNTASHCGFTPQYAGLEALWREHRDEGLTVLGFPCDQFGHQEPGDEDAIRDFCETRYGVSFPLSSKVEVNGKGAHPLFVALKEAAPGIFGTRAIKWNFTKFLVWPDGTIGPRFSPRDAPERLGESIISALAQSSRTIKAKEAQTS